jgi:glycosyltransferase involved in cell wall biosynthesis
MATLPYFVLSPSTILSLSGFLRGPDPTKPNPAEDWREATVDVIIPALNEGDNIALCLASLMRQTVQPRRIVLIDDGSKDQTVERALAFAEHHGLKLTAIRRRKPIGKTPTIKRQARELDSDVEFILDADTVLESENYIERTVQELYQAVGIASAFGTVLPQRKKDRRLVENAPELTEFYEANPSARPVTEPSRLRDFARGITNLYREVLYLFLQRFIYRGQVTFFGTTSNPVGCAVAYRRKYVRAMFDHVNPILGDDLTNSEDIFIGLAMLNEGYRNTQLADVYARTVEPPVHRLPRQIYLWSSAFLQSCYYFDPLLRSPFKIFKRWRAQRGRPSTPSSRQPVRQQTPALAGEAAAMATASPGLDLNRMPVVVPIRPARMSAVALSSVGEFGTTSGGGSGDRRMIREPYRQAFGRKRTEEFGRPAGWILLMQAIEKIFFPTSLLIMIILEYWEALAVTVLAEMAICLFALSLVMKGRRIEYALKGLATTPVRYALLASELVTIGLFASDLWITRNRQWRK